MNDVGSCNKKIVDVKNQKNCDLRAAIVINIRIGLSTDEAVSAKVNINTYIPRPGALAKAVKRSFELADKVFAARFSASRRLTHVYLFLELTIKKCRDNIQLIDLPAMMSCNRDNKPNGFPANCRGERFLVIHSMDLFVASGNNSCFCRDRHVDCDLV
jgi:hypothetical protein